MSHEEDGRADGQPDERPDEQPDGQPDGQSDGQPDGQSDERPDGQPDGQPDERAPGRRQFLHTIGKVAMAGGLVASYGTCAAFSGRYLYPAKDDETDWQFVTEVARMRPGEAMEYQAPDGAPINIARRAEASDVAAFIALSSVCPHLGCRVHWQGPENRFFCPCHNGVFTPEGKAVSGPPADAGQELARYPLRVESGLLYIRVPMVASASAALTPDAERSGPKTSSPDPERGRG